MTSHPPSYRKPSQLYPVLSGVCYILVTATSGLLLATSALHGLGGPAARLGHYWLDKREIIFRHNSV